MSKALPTTTPNSVASLDEPDASNGGASHRYGALTPDGTEHGFMFQRGPRRAPGSTPGLMEDDLLAILEDRLQAFQAGPFACPENQLALEGVQTARGALNRRVADRLARGVLGKLKA